MFDKVKIILIVLGQAIYPIVCDCNHRPALFVLFVRFIKIII